MDMVMTIVTWVNIIFILVLVGIGIYMFILFVKLANRGIKALDIYINDGTNKKS
jgi:uncharacterized membrane protein YqiK